VPEEGKRGALKQEEVRGRVLSSVTAPRVAMARIRTTFSNCQHQEKMDRGFGYRQGQMQECLAI
jgi:hypothetical protein